MRSWSVRTYLVLVMVGAVVCVAIASGYGFAWSSGQARADATDRMSFRAERAAASISAMVDTGREQVEALAAQPAITKVFDMAGDCTLVAKGMNAFPDVRLDVVGRDGVIACSSDNPQSAGEPGVHSGSPWLREVLDSPATLVTWDATDAATLLRAVVVAAPLMDAGTAIGAVVLFLQVPSSAPALATDLASADHASFTIVDRGSHVVLSTSEQPTQESGTAVFPDSRTEGDWAGVDGAHRLFGSADVAGTDWRVYAGADRSMVLATARGGLERQALAGLVALMVLGLAVWVLSRRVAGPLRAVTAAVLRAAREPGEGRVAEAGTAEVVALARAFNSMLDIRAGHDAQLTHQATHDPTTGLPNMLLVRDRLEHALRRDRDGSTVAVLCLGLSGFQTVTAGFGHEAGDRVLVEVAARLADVLRPGDTLARLGADEFLVVCEDAGENEAIGVAERLLHAMVEPFGGLVSDIVLHPAIGIAVADDAAKGAPQLLREADSAMRQAKSQGSAWCLFDDSLHVRATKHLAVEHALRQALRRDEFIVYYQPLLDVATGRIVGSEALVRWMHPDKGLVPPMDFIPTAEETGQIVDIGRLVLTRACQQAVEWAEAGYPLRMSVNVSVAQLRRTGFPDEVQKILTETGLAPDWLCLEITESSLVREVGQGPRNLDRLKAMGVHLAIDDFGTGYSSLSYLHQLPVGVLKIDQSFVSRLGQDPRDRHVIEAIAGMALALNLMVVAEGVETREQLEFVADLGCHVAQGYLIAAPQPAEAFFTLLAARRSMQPVAAAT